MKRVTSIAVAIVLALAGPAAADGSNDDDGRDGLVLVNAAQRLEDLGKIAKLRKVLGSRGLIHKLPNRLEAALDGRAVQIDDLDAIKEAVANQNYEHALEIIDQDETRILASATAGDPLPSLSELAELRGLIAAATDDEAEAIQWFRAARRFNSARQLDRASPRVRRLHKKARKETKVTGRLRVEVDAEGAEVRIDGGSAQPIGHKLELPIGYHLLTITAKGRTSYAELVEIKQGKLEKVALELDSESSADMAARLVDATVSAAPGRARLKKAKALSRVTGTKRYLMIEETGDDHVTVRLYDVNMRKVSKPVDLLDTASSATIMRLVNAAFDPDNLIEATQVTVIQQERSQRWYERWYVWVGVGAVVGGGILGYQYMSREPTGVRGF